MTLLIVDSGIGTGSLDEDVYCASYNEIAALERYNVGSMRAVGGERSVIEKRMPLLLVISRIHNLHLEG